MKRSESAADDTRWMTRALELAERGRFSVSPNPMVGAVLVRKGRVVGEGFHRRAGGPHAEVEALARAGARARGATLYVTLEPCAHAGRTPPCSEAVRKSGVTRVVSAARDPNPLVSGRGVRSLARSGVAIAWSGGTLRRRAEAQNEKFRVWIDRGRPFVPQRRMRTRSTQGSPRQVLRLRARRRFPQSGRPATLRP